MPVEAISWDVVVVGHWNRGILTPAGIARRLFGFAEGTPLPVEVPLDGIGAYRVRNDPLNVVVAAESTRLQVEATRRDYETLRSAIEIAHKAVAELPETPLTAAGINVRFRVTEPSALLLENTECKIDAVLSDLAYEISGRVVQRTVQFQNGQLNLRVTEEPIGVYELLFNFERKSNDRATILSWLLTPTTDIESEVNKILHAAFAAEVEEPVNG